MRVMLLRQPRDYRHDHSSHADDDNQAASGDVTITIPDGDDVDEEPDVVTGTTVGQELTADTSGVTDADHEDDTTTDNIDESILTDGLSYQWQTLDPPYTARPEPIDGATSKTYTPTEDDVGLRLLVVVMWSDKYGNGNDMPETLDVSNASDSLNVTSYDEARPFIIKEDRNGNEQLDPGDVLTQDFSGMFNDQDQLIDDNGDLIDGDTNDDTDDPENNPDPVAIPDSAVTFTWHRGDGPIYCDADDDGDIEEDADGNPTEECTLTMYTLADEDVAEDITLVASYSVKTGVDDQNVDVLTPQTPLTSDSAGTVISTNPPMGQPLISGVAQVGATLEVDEDGTSITDGDKVASITYSWYHGDDDDYSDALGTGSEYTLGPDDNEKTIKVRALVVDELGDMAYVSSEATSTIAGSPGEISRIEAAIRSVTASAGDTVTLSVDIYGLQDAKDNGLEATFTWKQTNGTSTIDLDEGSDREIDYPVPSSPGTYTVTASLGGGECQPEVEAEAREDDCNASITVQVRRPSHL